MSPMIELGLADSLSITTLVDNSIDSLLPNQGPAQRQRIIGREAAHVMESAPLSNNGDIPQELRAEHALSLLIDISVGGVSQRVLMDSGRTTGGLMSNMACLGIDPNSIDAVILSHGHGDHTGGLNGLANALDSTRRLPLYAHPDVFPPTRTSRPSGGFTYHDRLSEAALTSHGFEVVHTPDPTSVSAGIAVSGEVPRRTDFEITDGGNTQKQSGQEWVPYEILDEQATVLRTDKGLVVLVGCSHCGVINAIRYAQEITGEDRVQAVIGGFHLSGPRAEPAVEPTIDALVEIGPETIVPSHCSGLPASTHLADRLPDAFIPNSIGTKFVLA